MLCVNTFHEVRKIQFSLVGRIHSTISKSLVLYPYDRIFYPAQKNFFSFVVSIKNKYEIIKINIELNLVKLSDHDAKTIQP